MREAYPRFEEVGANVVAVAGRSAAVAHSLAPTMPFPLWLDPDQTLRAALAVDELSMSQVFHPRGALNYAKSWAQARNMRVYPEDVNNKPALFVLDAEQNVLWKHLGETLGDYPSIDRILEQL